MQFLKRLAAAGLLLAALAAGSPAQKLGSVALDTAQQKIFTGQTTPTVSPNTNTVFPCVPTNGSPCAIPNQSQSVHTLLYSAPSCGGIDLRLEGSYDGVTFFTMSQDALDVAPNPIGGLSGFGAVSAIGYYPVVRVNLVSLFGGGCNVTAFYSGSNASPPPTSVVAQQASAFRVPVTLNTVTSNAFTTIEIPTPFGSSGGSLWVQCSAACASGGAFTISASPSDTGLGSTTIVGTSIATVSTLQKFDIPSVNTNRVFVQLSPTAASANTWTVIYQFSPGGVPPPVKNQIVGGNVSGPGIVACDKFTPINTTASTQLLAGVAGKLFFICSLQFVNSIADNIALVEGTGATCGTATAGVYGGATAATGWNLGANGQVSLGTGVGSVGQTQVNADNLCLLVSSAAQVSGGFTWTLLQNP
jgi:hypothetical protein